MYVSRSVIAFEADSIRTVVAEVKELEAQTGVQVALIVIDTLARHIEGDENSTRDMTEFVRAVDGLRNAFPGSTAVIIHHTGNNAEAITRSRGSSALKAACDFEIQCDKGLLTFTKVKDGEQPEPMEFKLMPVEIGKDEDGEPITSCVVTYGERSQRHQGEALTSMERLAVQALADASVRTGSSAEENPAALVGDWRESFYTLRRAFLRAAEGLAGKKFIAEDGYLRILLKHFAAPSHVTSPSQSVTNDGGDKASHVTHLLYRCDDVTVSCDDAGYIQNPEEDLPLWN